MWKIPIHRWVKSEEKEPIRPEDYVGKDEQRNEQVVREGFPDKARRYLGMLPLAQDVVAMYFCMLDHRTPLWVKGTAAAALAYFILPVDAIPDMLPFVGLGDDASVLAAAIAAVSSHITDEHRKKAADWLHSERIEPAKTPKTGEATP